MRPPHISSTNILDKLGDISQVATASNISIWSGKNLQHEVTHCWSSPGILNLSLVVFVTTTTVTNCIYVSMFACWVLTVIKKMSNVGECRQDSIILVDDLKYCDRSW